MTTGSALRVGDWVRTPLMGNRGQITGITQHGLLQVTWEPDGLVTTVWPIAVNKCDPPDTQDNKT
jgi:hypothetical protein